MFLKHRKTVALSPIVGIENSYPVYLPIHFVVQFLYVAGNVATDCHPGPFKMLCRKFVATSYWTRF